MSLRFLDFSFKIQPKNGTTLAACLASSANSNVSAILKNGLDSSAEDIHTKQPLLHDYHIPEERKFFNGFVKDKRRAKQLLRAFHINLNSHIVQDIRAIKDYSRLFSEKDSSVIKLAHINSDSILASRTKNNHKSYTNKLTLSLQGLKVLEAHLLQLIYKQNVFDNVLSLKELELKYRFNMKMDIIALIEAKMKDFALHTTIFNIKKEQLPIAYTTEKNLQTILALFGYLSYSVDKKTLSEIISKTFEKDFITRNDNFLASY